METLLNALPWIVGGLILILLLAALRRPLEWLVRLAARTGVGLAALWALSGVGGLVELHLGVNLVNALVLGAGRARQAPVDVLTGRWRCECRRGAGAAAPAWGCH